jgi:organic hydroperoxide reductase OsmC/OhrA
MAIKPLHHYEALLRWTGAAKGPVRGYKDYSREYEVQLAGKPLLRGSADPSFLGDPELVNPEDMLLAALSACHMLSFFAECAFAKVEVHDYEDNASGTMVFEGRGGQFTDVLLRPNALLSNCDEARALELHERAHKSCFIARSVNFPVRHEAVSRFRA